LCRMEAAMFPEGVTQENFPLWAHVSELLEQATRSGPGGRCNRPVRDLDRLTVSQLTVRGVELYRNRNLAHAENVLKVAIKIQEWLHHPSHADLSFPLLALGEVYAAQRRLHEAAITFSRAMQVSAHTDARIEQHKMALVCLMQIYRIQGRLNEEEQMRSSLKRLRGENPFLIKDRPNRPYE
jgi:hypothetical protein